MKISIKIITTFLFIFLYNQTSLATAYYVHPIYGNELNCGVSKKKAFKKLSQLSKIRFKAGDKIILANGQEYNDCIRLIQQNGNSKKPITISSTNWESDSNEPAKINFKNYPVGIYLEDCSFIRISNIQLTADGYFKEDNINTMRSGIVITTKSAKFVENITIENVAIKDVYFENKGFQRGKEEIKTANGTQKYGWGIRLINSEPQIIMQNISIQNCNVNSVCHTGIKLTGANQNIRKVKILNNKVEYTGGPGIQMSEVQDVYVANNIVNHSGSNNDSRKWGRGSGLWTWGSSNVLIEKNKFLFANGPGDSAGAHIDYNCDSIVLQYNLSAYNAGGFCEILGNNYNCIYRYNVSVNDGYRIKGVDGNFQEGKVFWLSGYQGGKEPKGPVNSYFYNNTIFSDESIEAKFAIDNTSRGLVFANNIFCIKGGTKSVLGDQNKKDTSNGQIVEEVFFENNLFLDQNTWPKDLKVNAISKLFGNPNFVNEGGIKIEDYIPTNTALIQNQGIEIPTLSDCGFKLIFDLKMQTDILGNKIEGKPSIGVIHLN